MFKLEDQESLLHFQSRTENHGTEKEPAATIAFTVRGPNTLLDNLEKGLRAMYYKKPSKAESEDLKIDMDLADQAEIDETDLVKLRSIHLKNEFKHSWEGAGYRVVIGGGLNESTDIILVQCELKNFKITLMEGGTVQLKFSVNCKPNEKEAGQLHTRNDSNVTLTLEPPSAEQQAQADLAA